MTNIRPHSTAAKWVHWGFIGVFIFALTKQLDEVEELEDLALLESEMIFATVFLLLLVARFVFMQFTRPTALPADTPVREMRLARLVHLGMYFGLALIAVTGLVIGSFYGSGTKTGDLMDAMLILHEIGVNGTYTLIVLHVAAALYHRHKGDGIWNAMVPVWRASRTPEQRDD